MSALWQDVRFGLRMLHKNLGVTVFAVLTLGIGIGANTALFSLVHGVLLSPLPFPQPDRIMLVQGTWKEEEGYVISGFPPEYAKGMGDKGKENLAKFLDGGGIVVSWEAPRPSRRRRGCSTSSRASRPPRN